MIGNSNYIGTILIELIQEIKRKEKNPIHFIQRNDLLLNILERIIGLAINYLDNYITMIFIGNKLLGIWKLN